MTTNAILYYMEILFDAFLSVAIIINLCLTELVGKLSFELSNKEKKWH